MFQQIIVLLLVFSCVSASLPFTDCGSTFEVRALRISGCDAIPCMFRRGDTHVIEMDVTSKYNSTALPYVVTGRPPFLPPIPILSGNACTSLTVGSCPTVPGVFYTARILYKVSYFLPKMSFPVTFTVRDDASGTPVCGQIVVRIVA